MPYNREQQLDRARRLKEARIARGYPTAAAAAEAFNWNRNSYSSNENGNAPYSFRKAKQYAEAFGFQAVWLYDGEVTEAEPARRQPNPEGLVPIIGSVGDNPGGAVTISSDSEGVSLAPLPPGGTAKSVALRVTGHGLRNIADNGGLIYFEDHRRPPLGDMQGSVVVVETVDGDLFVGRLFRGTRAGRYVLAGDDGSLMTDQILRWASHIIAIIPAHQAKRIIRTAGE